MDGQDNYGRVREEWRRRFLEMDCAALARRFHLRADDENLFLRYFSRPYAVSRKTGRIVRIDRPEEEIGFNTAMNFYNMFHYAVPEPVPSGVLVPFCSVRRVYPFEAAYRKNILDPMGRYFDGRADALRRALDALHAAPVRQGDAGGELEVFPGLRLAVILWDGDEEFPAQVNMLFDSNITDFMHEENVVCVASDAARFLAEESGLGPSDSGFSVE